MAKKKPKLLDLSWVAPLVAEMRQAAEQLNDLPEDIEATMPQAEALDDLRVASSRLYEMADATIPH